MQLGKLYLQKQPFLCTLKNLKSRFWLAFCSIFTKVEPKSALHLGFWQIFSQDVRKSRASEKNSVGFRKNIFHAYFSCKSAIARDMDFCPKSKLQQ